MSDSQPAVRIRVLRLDWGFHGLGAEPYESRRFDWTVHVPPTIPWSASTLRRTIDDQLIMHDMTLRHSDRNDLVINSADYTNDTGTTVRGHAVSVGLPEEIRTTRGTR